MDISTKKLQVARKIMVRIIQSRTDGADYLDIVLELERQIVRAADKNSELDRIMSEAA
ncbi:hypothetical protein [Sulfitobacter sp.]|uniref:hypothetical protein n=1 Tax=Sulfitobacter sp. TaxID=1903071 RepID=UPI00329854B7